MTPPSRRACIQKACDTSDVIQEVRGGGDGRGWRLKGSEWRMTWMTSALFLASLRSSVPQNCCKRAGRPSPSAGSSRPYRLHTASAHTHLHTHTSPHTRERSTIVCRGCVGVMNTDGECVCRGVRRHGCSCGLCGCNVSSGALFTVSNEAGEQAAVNGSSVIPRLVKPSQV